LLKEATRTVLAARPSPEDITNYYPASYTQLPLSEPDLEIDPFDKGDVGAHGKIEIRRYTGTLPECEGKECRIAQFHGSLYGTCGCLPQGYSVLLGPDGEVIQFLSSNLRWGHRTEDWIKRAALDRLSEMANDPALLEQAYAAEPGYLARKSVVSNMPTVNLPGGGVSVGTFVVHLSKVRDRLYGKSGWPRWTKGSPR
jgi:hypothetical protein